METPLHHPELRIVRKETEAQLKVATGPKPLFLGFRGFGGLVGVSGLGVLGV